jgi:S1-C subfamily serine protease
LALGSGPNNSAFTFARAPAKFTAPARQRSIANSTARGSPLTYTSTVCAPQPIVTNAHVISPPRSGQVEKIDVLFANGDHVAGHVTAVDRNADLALVKVDNYAKLPPALPLGDSKSVEAGQWAIAIGEPLGLRQTVTVGVVSGFRATRAPPG